MERFLKAAALATVGLFLLSRLTAGVILFYINQRFVTLTWAGALALILVGLSYYLHHRNPNTDHGSRLSAHGTPPHEAEHSHPPLTWPSLLIIALPLLLGWLIPPRPLGAAALGNREINVGNFSDSLVTAQARGSGQLPLRSIPAPQGNNDMGLIHGERNILDWLIDFQLSGDPAQFQGQEARVVGFVFRDERFAENTFMVGRYIVSCCVADANPIGLIVRSPQTATLEADQWIEVSGRFELGQFDGQTLPILVADQITLTDPPLQPYLYQ